MKNTSIFASAAMILATAAIATANPFSDVPASHWAYDAVNSMAEKGIVQGFPDGTFKGKQNVTRYQLAMITAKMIVVALAARSFILFFLQIITPAAPVKMHAAVAI